MRSRQLWAEYGCTTPNVSGLVRCEIRAIAHAAPPQVFRKSDRVALQIKHQSGQAVRLDAAEAAIRRHDETCRRVRRNEFAVDDFVANRRPADFAMQFHINPEFREQAEFLRHRQRRAIRERNEAHADRMRAMIFAQCSFRMSDARRT